MSELRDVSELSDVSEFRDVAIDLAQRSSTLIRYYFDTEVEVQCKEDGTPVTQADLEVNQLTLDTIAATFPDHGFVGEEISGNSAEGREYVWMCDPIDGTRAFTLGLPLSTYSLALVRNGKPIVGVVAYPFRDWLFVAEAGGGATLNGKPIHVSDASSLRGQVLDVTSFTRHSLYVPGLTTAIDQAGGIPIYYCSVAISAAFVARGAYCASIWSGNTPWDAAAVKVIVEEAGGRFTDLDGNDQRYDGPVAGFVASNGATHNEILDLIQTCKKQS